MKRIVVATLTALTLISCSPSWSADLTRPQAKAILSRSKVFTSAYNQLSFVDNGIQEFVAEGGANNPEFVKVFTVATPGTVFNIGNAAANTITLRTPLPARVDEITGIADAGQGRKEVLFRWSLVNVPDVLKPFVVVGGTGRAIMRLYDDGWRVENGPNLSNNTTPPPLTSVQQRQVETFKEAVRNRQQDQQRDLQLWREKLIESTKPTKVVYSVKAQPPYARTSRLTWDVVDVTDAGITVTTNVSDSKPGSAPTTTPWLCVDSINLANTLNGQGQLERSRIKLSEWLGPNEFSVRYSSIRLIDIMKGTGCGQFGPNVDFTNPEQAQQVYGEMQKAYQEWMATYKSIIPVAAPR